MSEDLLQKLFSEPFMFIGYFSGPILFVGISSYFLYYQMFFWFLIYIIFYLINIWIILTLQKFWKDPRPINGIEFMKDEFKNKDVYGMPSGHTQTVFFSLVFFYMKSNSIVSFILMLFIALCTMLQRYLYRKHTIMQIIVGGIIGSIYGYFTYLCINHYKKNGYLIYNNVSK